MLPNFLIIGAQKAATTYLARRLEEHPDVYLALQKEIHYFNHRYDRGLDWYEPHFEGWSGQKAVGEATPGYLNHPEAPERIRATLGDQVRLIASLRHPVDRAYSAFWHYSMRGKIPPETDFKTFFLDSNAFGLRSRGFYFEHLTNYFQIFPRERFLIFIYEEDLKGENESALRACLNFLGLEAEFAPVALERAANQSRDIKMFQTEMFALRRGVVSQIRRLPEGVRQPIMALGRRANEQVIMKLMPKKDDYAPLDKDVRRELMTHYQSDIEQLGQLLGRDLSVWYA